MSEVSLTVWSEPKTWKVTEVNKVVDLDTYATMCGISVHAIVEAKQPTCILKKLILVELLLLYCFAEQQYILF